MARIKVFNNVTLDGYFTGERGDMSFFHRPDAEMDDFASQNAAGDEGVLLFGRVTYEMMAAYWPTPQAKQALPAVAEGMNRRRKVVFSRTLEKATWENTRLIKEDLVGEVRKMKAGPGPDVVIMGSGTLVAQLTDARLIDEYQLVLHPLVIGRGRTLFEKVKEPLSLELKKTRTFSSGNVVLWYEPKA
jgi:dihydrofolate reductase